MSELIGLFVLLVSLIVFWFIVRIGTRADAVVSRLDEAIKRLDAIEAHLRQEREEWDGGEEP